VHHVIRHRKRHQAPAVAPISAASYLSMF
jgi:hypothetical protein